MSFKVGDILNGARIDGFEPGTILKQLEGTRSYDSDEDLWVSTDNYTLVGIKQGLTWNNDNELGNFEIIKLPG